MLCMQTFYKKVNKMSLCCVIIEWKTKEEEKKKKKKKEEICFKGVYALICGLVLD